MIRKERIAAQLEKHYDHAVDYIKDEFRLLGVFLYGSQNYNLDMKESDVDAIALVFPTKTDIIFSKTMLSAEIHWHDGDKEQHTVVKDIRLFFMQLKKQSFTAVEILHTDYKKLNLFYESEWEEFFEWEYGTLNMTYFLSNIQGLIISRKKDYLKGRNPKHGAYVFYYMQLLRSLALGKGMAEALSNNDYKDVARAIRDKKYIISETMVEDWVAMGLDLCEKLRAKAERVNFSTNMDRKNFEFAAVKLFEKGVRE